MTSPLTPRLLSIITPSTLKQCINLPLSKVSNENFTPNNPPKLSKNSDYTLTETSAKTLHKAPIIPSSSKPSLNTLSSRNKLIEYSHSKKYREDKIEFCPDFQKEETTLTNSSPEPIDEYEELLLYQQNHLPVPIEKKNDEKFKILKMKQMKRLSVLMNNSVNKYDELLPDYEKNFRNVLDYSTIKKKKVSHSTRKIYTSMLTCYNSNHDEVLFPLFTDKDIGIYEYWQAHIIDSKADEDVMTDNEQLTIASSYVAGEIKEAFEKIKKEGNDAFVNFNRFDFE